jgi:AcrR family transcriptional regulator
MPDTEKPPARRTQADRTRATRERILKAAHDTLMARGYAGASTWAVCETGGFSKGTLLHHFRQRTDLFNALIVHLGLRSLASLDAAIQTAPPGQRIDVFLGWLWSTLEGDFFVVGLEVLTAARTEPELGDAIRQGADELSRLLDRFIDSTLEDVPAGSADLVRSALQTSVHLVRGIGLDLSVGGNLSAHRERFDDWANTVRVLSSGKFARPHQG